MIDTINSADAPPAIGPYSHATVLGDLVFTSGQLPVHPESGKVPVLVEEQTRQAIKNLATVLEASGSSLQQVLKVTIFISNMDDFADINSVYGTFFTAPYPARSCVEVARLPKDVLVEIEAVGVRKV